MNIKKLIIYHNKPTFNELRKAIKERRTKDYETHIKEILNRNKKNKGFSYYKE